MANEIWLETEEPLELEIMPPYIGSAYAPQVDVGEISGGHSVAITYDDSDSGITTKRFDVMDGEQGPQGVQGPQGERGPQGAQGPQGERGETGATGPQGAQGPKGDTGATGATGAAAGFGTVSATVDGSTGMPSVEVTASGADTAKSFAFAFHNLKGDPGDVQADGRYPTLSAGTADTLGWSDPESDTWARRVSLYDGTARVERVLGRTVVWNQLAHGGTNETKGGVAFTFADGKVHISGTATAAIYKSITASFPFTENHQYLFKVGLRGYANCYAYVNTTMPNGNAIAGTGSIKTAPATVSTNITVYIASGTVIDTTVIPLVVDLTLAFGAGNEPSTVAEFERMFPADYYPYDAGSLLSVNAVGVESVGRNVAKPMELGWFIDTTSRKVLKETTQQSFIAKVTPNTQYVLSYSSGNMLAVGAVDSETPSAGSLCTMLTTTMVGTNTRTFTSGSTEYVMVYLSNNASTNPVEWAQIEAGSTATPYKPYRKSTRALPISTYFTDGMKSAGTAADALYDDHAETVVGAVDLGTLTWYQGVTYQNIFYSRSDALFAVGVHGKMQVSCVEYAPVSTQTSGQLSLMDKCISFQNNAPTIQICNASFANAQEAKAGLSGVIAYYELATPTTQSIDPPLNLTYPTEQGGTESLVLADGVQSAPPTWEVVYAYDADGIVDKSHSVIAPVENGRASANYAVGSYLVRGGTLYRVTSAIATGEAITPGTNVVATTVMAEIVRLTA